MINMDEGIYSLVLINSAGQKLLSTLVKHKAAISKYKISLPAGITKGTYQLCVKAQNAKQHNIKILVE